MTTIYTPTAVNVRKKGQVKINLPEVSAELCLEPWIRTVVPISPVLGLVDLKNTI